MEALSPDDPRAQLFASCGFDKSLKGLTLVSVEGDVAVAKIEVCEDVSNMLGTLHGGAIATLVDDVGTVAVMSADRDGRPGVTTDLNVSYFRAAQHGMTVTIEGRCLKAGRTLAFVQVDLKDADGKLLAQGRMTKFMGG
jgi:acyl-coenzyme A thioesterase 13